MFDRLTNSIVADTREPSSVHPLELIAPLPPILGIKASALRLERANVQEDHTKVGLVEQTEEQVGGITSNDVRFVLVLILVLFLVIACMSLRRHRWACRFRAPGAAVAAVEKVVSMDFAIAAANIVLAAIAVAVEFSAKVFLALPTMSVTTTVATVRSESAASMAIPLKAEPAECSDMPDVQPTFLPTLVDVPTPQPMFVPKPLEKQIALAPSAPSPAQPIKLPMAAAPAAAPRRRERRQSGAGPSSNTAADLEQFALQACCGAAANGSHGLSKHARVAGIVDFLRWRRVVGGCGCPDHRVVTHGCG